MPEAASKRIRDKMARGETIARMMLGGALSCQFCDMIAQDAHGVDTVQNATNRKGYRSTGIDIRPRE